MMHTTTARRTLVIMVFTLVGLAVPFSQMLAQESTAQVVMRPITTVHSSLVIQRLSTQVTDAHKSQVEVEINPVNGDVKLRSADLPGGQAFVRVFDQSGTIWYSGSMRARKGSDRFSTSDFPVGRFAIQILDEHEVVRHRYVLIKN
ncbi:MAG: hypothetical protein R2787_17690 [Saprospiraceae bacterium]